MACKIRQEYNIFNRQNTILDTTSDAYEEKVHIDRLAYNGPLLAYPELVGFNDDPSYPWWYLIQNGYFNSIWNIKNRANVYRCQRSDFLMEPPDTAINQWWETLSEGTEDVYSQWSTSATGNGYGRNQKVVILQNADKISRTKACFNVGVYEVFDYSDTSKHAALYPKVWKYESSKFSPTPTFTFSVTYENEASNAVSFILEESSDAAFTSPTDKVTLSGLTSQTAAFVESTSFTPTNGYYYRVACQQTSSMKGSTLFQAYVNSYQTGTEEISRTLPSTASGYPLYGGSSVGTYEALCQPFTTSGAFNCVGIDCVIAKANAPTDGLYIEIRSGSPSGTLLGTSATVSELVITQTGLTVIHFKFATPVSLSASTTYYVVMERTGARDTGNGNWWFLSDDGGDLSGVYGQIRNSGSWSAASGTNDFMMFVYSAVISKTQTEMCLLNIGNQSTTGKQDQMSLYNPDDWDDGQGGKPTAYHEHVGGGSSSNSKIISKIELQVKDWRTASSFYPGFGSCYFSGYLIVAAGSTGLRSYEISSDGVMTLKDTDKQGSNAYYTVCADANFIYVACGDGLRSYSIDGSGNLTYIDLDYQGSDQIYDSVYSDGTYIYVASRLDGLRAYSVDGSGYLTHIDADYQGSGSYVDVDGDGSYIYVACTDNLRAYSFNGSTLTHIDADYQGSSSYYGVFCQGGFIFVAEYAATTANVRSHSFNGTTITHIDSKFYGGSMQWITGDGTLILAVGYSEFMFVYSYDGSGYLTLEDSYNVELSPFGDFGKPSYGNGFMFVPITDDGIAVFKLFNSNQDISNSSITGQNLTRSSALTLPTDPRVLDVNIVAA